MIIIEKITLERVERSPSKKAQYSVNGKTLFAEEAAIEYYKNKGYDSIWSENHYWCHVLGLLFWDVIYAKIQGAVTCIINDEEFEPSPNDRIFKELFEHTIKTNGIPSDFFKPEFYPRRKELIENRISMLMNKNLSSELRESFDLHYNRSCRLIEDWDKYTIDQLTICTQKCDNNTLLSLLDRMLSNYKEYRSGLPDLIVYNDNKFFFSEVKSVNDRLSQKQKDWHKFLSEMLKFDVELLLINHDNIQKEKILKSYESRPIKNSIEKESAKKLPKPEGELIEKLRLKVKGISKRKQIDLYFNLLNQIQELKKQSKYKEMLQCCDSTLPLIEALIILDEKDFGQKWDGTSGLGILAIDYACDYLPAYEDYNKLKIYGEFVNAMPKLAYYKPVIDRAFQMYDIVQGLKKLFNDKDEVFQKDVKKLLGYSDGRAISRAIHYLENIGKVKRKKTGTTYLITWPEIVRKRKRDRFIKKLFKK